MQNASGNQAGTELGIFLNAIWKRRWWIVVGTAATVAVAATALALRAEQYEARARLAVAEYRISPTASPAATRATYAALIRSQTVAQRLVDQHGLADSLDMTPPELLERLSVELVAGTSLVEVAVELPDPQLALEVCLGFAEGAVELTRTVNDADRTRARDVLTSQLGTTNAKVAALEAALAESGGAAAVRALESELEIYLERRQSLQEQWGELIIQRREQEASDVAARLDAAKQDLVATAQERQRRALETLLDGTLEQWNEFRNQHDRVTTALEAESARLQQAEAELAGMERLFSVNYLLSEGTLLAEASRSRSGASAPIGLQSDYVNPVYEDLELEVARGRSDVQALQRQKEELARQLETYDANAESLERALAQASSDIEAKQRIVDLGIAEYSRLFERAPAGVLTALAVVEQQLDQTERTIVDVQTRLATRDAELDRLESDFATSLEISADLAQQLESSAVTVAGQIADLVLVDEPILPRDPSSPGAVLLLGGALVFGFLLSLLFAGVAAGMESTSPTSR